MKCDGRSNEGNVCERDLGHVGCHEAWIDGDSRRWWEPKPGLYDTADLGEWRPSSGSMLRVPLRDGRIAVVDSGAM